MQHEVRPSPLVAVSPVAMWLGCFSMRQHVSADSLSGMDQVGRHRKDTRRIGPIVVVGIVASLFFAAVAAIILGEPSTPDFLEDRRAAETVFEDAADAITAILGEADPAELAFSDWHQAENARICRMERRIRWAFDEESEATEVVEAFVAIVEAVGIEVFRVPPIGVLGAGFGATNYDPAGYYRRIDPLYRYSVFGNDPRLYENSGIGPAPDHGWVELNMAYMNDCELPEYRS